MIILRLLIKFAYIYVNVWKYIYLYICQYPIKNPEKNRLRPL